jgi:PPOX class probable F420-dependent enzyme
MLQRAGNLYADWVQHPALEPFTRTKTIVLTTYRRDGTPVTTPVSIAFDGDRAFFRTWHTAGKAKRLRRDPSVEIAPCTLAGTRTGPAIHAHARLLTGAESRQAARALARRHPLLQRMLVPLAHRLLGYRTQHYELIPDVG